MFVTKEELELVEKWNQSVSRTDSEPRFIELDDFLLKQTVPNSKLLFIHSSIRQYGNDILLKDYYKTIHIAFAVTEEGFSSFKLIHDQIKYSILLPHNLSTHFMSKKAIAKDDTVEPFIFTAAVIGFQIEAKTHKSFVFQTEQYVNILSKAFKKGYEHATA